MPHESAEDRELMRMLLAVGEGAPGMGDKLHLVRRFRRTADGSRRIDELLLGQLIRLEQGLREARETQGELRTMIDSLVAPPWLTGILMRMVMTEAGPRALVMHAGTRRVVAVSEDVNLDLMTPGDEVYLARELNVVLGRSPDGMPRFGETAHFERRTGDGRLVLKCRDDEEVVVDAAGPLLNKGLESGDQVRWDRSVWLAFEKMERSKGTHLFMEETPDERFENIGGLDSEIEQLKRCIELHMKHAPVVQRYRLRRTNGILLVGKAGVGKTMLVRALCNWIAAMSPSGRSRFMNIKPAGLHSMWYSQSEANYREAFRVAREAANAEPDVPVIMFFDEVDSVGASRGAWGMRVDDRVQTALMAELDGVERRGNILVLAATNRHAIMDAALVRPGRLGDQVIEIPRPNMKAARAIFGKYLLADLPYAVNGRGGNGAEAREHIIDSVLSHLYSPNGDSELATLVFRDGARRPVRAAEVMNGAIIAQITNSAKERACTREIETGEVGLRVDDLLSAAREQCATAAHVLTPANCREHLSGLPDDMDVVSVLQRMNKVKDHHSYLNPRT